MADTPIAPSEDSPAFLLLRAELPRPAKLPQIQDFNRAGEFLTAGDRKFLDNFQAHQNRISSQISFGDDFLTYGDGIAVEGEMSKASSKRNKSGPEGHRSRTPDKKR